MNSRSSGTISRSFHRPKSLRCIQTRRTHSIILLSTSTAILSGALAAQSLLLAQEANSAVGSSMNQNSEVISKLVDEQVPIYQKEKIQSTTGTKERQENVIYNYYSFPNSQLPADSEGLKPRPNIGNEIGTTIFPPAVESYNTGTEKERQYDDVFAHTGEPIPTSTAEGPELQSGMGGKESVQLTTVASFKSCQPWCELIPIPWIDNDLNAVDKCGWTYSCSMCAPCNQKTVSESIVSIENGDTRKRVLVKYLKDRGMN